ncbi:MAG: M13 family metallopeptidase [Acidobacteriaceae bacterium]|nr:M13 family metallopeptidase [Acidobacteriaceae bacterium]
MQLIWVALLVASLGSLHAQETPLSVLPYTPSLERGFMDRSADPCVDFYKYACGNWSKLNPIPADQPRWDVYSKLSDENQRFLWGILEQASHPNPSRTPNEQKIGDFFHACMDTDSIERAGASPLDSRLAQIAALKSVNDIATYVGQQHHHGIHTDIPFDFDSNPDFDNSSQMIAFAGAGGLGLPDRDYYTKTDPKSQEIRTRYVQHVRRMFEMLGESQPDAQTDAQTVMSIETALAQASLTRVEMRNPYNLKHKMSRADLRHVVPAFDWDAYFDRVDAPEFHIVNVEQPKFFEQVNQQLSSRNLASWRAYLRWHLVHAEAPYLSSKFVQENFDFFSHYLRGIPEMPPRWKRCTRLVDSELGEALGQVFVVKTFAPQTKDDALRMTREIEAEMGRDIKDLTWMSDATKQRALEKLHAIVNKIGYPDRWRDYSSVQIMPDDFIGDITRASTFEVHRQLTKIGKPVDRTEWFMTPPTVDAYYNTQTNDINFPAGVLQPPLFDPKMDGAPNYGNTGATIGHELTHGFDDEGRQFDAQGNLKDWWTPADAKAFEQRVACVRNQYAQYIVVDDIHINSSLTLGEDVADLGGTLLAYIGWKHSTKDQDLKPIDGFTPDQRFFIGMAQWACGDERPENKRMNAITNPHSPDEYRINGVVANLPSFGEAFGCKVGQPMMRVNACRVW